MEYKTLEPSSLSSLGVPVPTFSGNFTSFLATSTFLYALLFSAIVMAAFYRYVTAGVIRMQSSENAIRQSNEIIKKVTLGLLGVFSLFLILFTVNKGLVTGDVGLSGLKAGRGTGAGGLSTTLPPAVNTSSSGGSSRACEPADVVKTRLQSPEGICGGTRCTALSGCNYQQYNSIIDQEVGGDAQLKKMIIVTMCKESRGKKDAQNRNPDGTFDCGLMQINGGSSCTEAIFQESTNIREGVRLMRQKISYSSQTYPALKTRPEAGVFTSYNCCSNGTVPNSPSESCKQSDGWPLIPKWACPLDPGTSAYNMCSVKSYACDLVACLNQL